MAEMKNIKGNPTLVLDANDLNIKRSCPYCGAGNDRIIYNGKDWKCLDCFKSFKKPNIVGKNTSTISNIKLFNDLPKPSIDDLVGNSDINNEEGLKALITDSREIENFVATEKNETTSQIQEENKEISPRNSETFIKSDLSSMIKLSDKLETTELPKLVKRRTIIKKRQ
jgi:hypothetical protein